jgi:hypothetical protein
MHSLLATGHFICAASASHFVSLLRAVLFENANVILQAHQKLIVRDYGYVFESMR